MKKKEKVIGSLSIPCPKCSAKKGHFCNGHGVGVDMCQARISEFRRRKAKRKPKSTIADVRRAKAAFDEHRARKEAVGMEVCLVVVGYASGREPFRLLGRVDADTGMEAMPDPPLTMAEMQPVMFAAKMAFARALNTRRELARGKRAKGMY